MGGHLYDGTDLEKEFDGKNSEDNPEIKGIIDLFGTRGSSKITITPKTRIDQLMTIPGIFPEGDDIDDQEASKALAQAILDGLNQMPEDDNNVDETREWWPYKDWNDLVQRVEDISDSNMHLGEEAKEYIEWQTSETSEFKMKITAESMGMKHEATCICYVKDKKVRYTEWREN